MEDGLDDGTVNIAPAERARDHVRHKLDLMISYLKEENIACFPSEKVDYNPRFAMLYGALVGISRGDGIRDATLLVNLLRDCVGEDDIEISAEIYKEIPEFATAFCKLGQLEQRGFTERL